MKYKHISLNAFQKYFLKLHSPVSHGFTLFKQNKWMNLGSWQLISTWSQNFTSTLTKVSCCTCFFFGTWATLVNSHENSQIVFVECMQLLFLLQSLAIGDCALLGHTRLEAHVRGVLVAWVIVPSEIPIINLKWPYLTTVIIKHPSVTSMQKRKKGTNNQRTTCMPHYSVLLCGK